MSPRSRDAGAVPPGAVPPGAVPPGAVPPGSVAGSELVRTALAAAEEGPAPGGSGTALATTLAAAADRRTRDLVDRFVHQAGPPPSRFAWVALGSHARGELHCASDQDHALVWQAEPAARSSYATDLAHSVITGLTEFGMRPCDGGYMADRWSTSLADWVARARERVEAPTPQAVLDTDIFLDLRVLSGDLDMSAAHEVLLLGADSPRLLHGLATAANSFAPPRGGLGRLRSRPLDLKRSGLAPLVLLARLYGLRARSSAVGTLARFAAAGEAGVLSSELSARLAAAFELLTRLRLQAQLRQVVAGHPLSDVVEVEALAGADQRALRGALRAVRSAQSVTAVTFRTDL